MINIRSQDFIPQKEKDAIDGVLNLLVSMDVAGTICIAEVYKSGVDHLVFLAFIQKILQVAEVPVATSHTVPSTVLV